MKQTLIIFVQDEPGVLNRVSSHIRRKNFNIESIAAGHTERKGITRITLVLNEPNKTKQSIVVNSLKQLIDVYDVIDATKIKSYIREYAMIKILLNDNEIIDIENVIKSVNGHLVSSLDNIFIFELTGSKDDVELVIIALEKYNILEIVRSGMVAMIEGNDTLYKPQLEKTEPNWSTFRIMESF
jgi:acetolactate synthase-1/3 small subunit